MRGLWLMILVTVLAAGSLRASEDKTFQNIAQEPDNCLNESVSVCGFKTARGQKIQINFNSAKINVGEDTSLVKKNLNEIILMSGSLLLQTTDSVKVISEFGDIVMEGGEALFTHEKKRVVVKVIQGEVTLLPKGSKEKLIIQSGFENYLSFVTKGVAATGIPSAFSSQNFIREYTKILIGSKKEVMEKVRSFQSKWKESVEEASVLHEKIIERQIANIQEEEKRREEARKKRQKEERELRKMYRKNNYLD